MIFKTGGIYYIVTAGIKRLNFWEQVFMVGLCLCMAQKLSLEETAPDEHFMTNLTFCE
jgi:hypothetical protein